MSAIFIQRSSDAIALLDAFGNWRVLLFTRQVALHRQVERWLVDVAQLRSLLGEPLSAMQSWGWATASSYWSGLSHFECTFGLLNERFSWAYCTLVYQHVSTHSRLFKLSRLIEPQRIILLAISGYSAVDIERFFTETFCWLGNYRFIVSLYSCSAVWFIIITWLLTKDFYVVWIVSIGECIYSVLWLKYMSNTNLAVAEKREVYLWFLQTMF